MHDPMVSSFTRDMNSILITDKISRLADNKAAGTDGLGSLFIKQLVRVIELLLVLIFRESLRSG